MNILKRASARPALLPPLRNTHENRDARGLRQSCPRLDVGVSCLHLVPSVTLCPVPRPKADKNTMETQVRGSEQANLASRDAPWSLLQYQLQSIQHFESAKERLVV